MKKTTIIALLYLTIILQMSCSDNIQSVPLIIQQKSNTQKQPQPTLDTQRVIPTSNNKKQIESTTAEQAVIPESSLGAAAQVNRQPLPQSINSQSEAQQPLISTQSLTSSILKMHELSKQSTAPTQTFQADPLQTNLIQQQQQVIYQKQIQSTDQKLSQWISSQLDRLHEQQTVVTHQTFDFILDSKYHGGNGGTNNKQAVFKWNPSKTGTFKMIVNIYQIVNGMDVIRVSNPQQGEYVGIDSRADVDKMYRSLGKVYISNMVLINFYSDYQVVRFKSFYPQMVIVSVSLEATVFVLDQGISDGKFKLPAQKTKILLKQLQQTQQKQQKMFKSQWSFKDREQRHQSQMLIFTGIQLIVILGTAIVQMWCIKQLLDNRIIV